MPLGTFDLNLLKVLDALLTERSVTRAGLRLGRSQPAVSSALQRLRSALGDDLLVRGAEGLVLTPRAEALRAPLRALLQGLEGELFASSAFDPAQATGAFRIATPDRLSLAIVPRLFQRLHAQAPRMGLHVATADREHALHLLDTDAVDLALGWIDRKPAHMRSQRLHEDRLDCVFRRGHPLATARRFTMERLLSFPHVVVSASGGRSAIFDDLIAARGLRREALVTVSNFTAVSQLLAGSEMIGVFTSLASRVFESRFGLARRRMPIDLEPIATDAVWHARYDRDPAHCWLRGEIRALYESL